MEDEPPEPRIWFYLNQQKDCCDPPRDVGEVLDLLGEQQPAQDLALPVGEPILDDLNVYNANSARRRSY